MSQCPCIDLLSMSTLTPAPSSRRARGTPGTTRPAPRAAAHTAHTRTGACTAARCGPWASPYERPSTYRYQGQGLWWHLGVWPRAHPCSDRPSGGRGADAEAGNELLEHLLTPPPLALVAPRIHCTHTHAQPGASSVESHQMPRVSRVRGWHAGQHTAWVRCGTPSPVRKCPSLNGP
jgi:hypothetical protein